MQRRKPAAAVPPQSAPEGGGSTTKGAHPAGLLAPIEPGRQLTLRYSHMSAYVPTRLVCRIACTGMSSGRAPAVRALTFVGTASMSSTKCNIYMLPSGDRRWLALFSANWQAADRSPFSS